MREWQEMYKPEGCLWGVSTGASGLIVVDLDVKNGKNGIAEWLFLQKKYGPAPKTFTVQTKSGGKHLYFMGLCRSSIGSVDSRGKLRGIANGIDIKSSGGFVVFPDAPGYSILENVEIAEAPPWLLALTLPPRQKRQLDTIRAINTQTVDLPADLEAGRHLLNTWPVPQKGEIGDSVYRAACRLRDRALTVETASVLVGEWAERVGLEDIGGVLKVVGNAYEYALGESGSDSVATRFGEADEVEIPPLTRSGRSEALCDDLDLLGVESDEEAMARIAYADKLRSMNAEWFISHAGGKVQVFHLEYNAATGSRELRGISVHDFQSLYANEFVDIQTESGIKPISVGVWWYKHPLRRQFLKGILFDPTGADTPGYYNLWTGWAVKPLEGSWDLLRSHIWENIAQQNQEWMDYILNWMAWYVQHPESPAEVAMILQGSQGVGKSILGQYLGMLAAASGKTYSGGELLSGRFSGHLRNCVFLCVNEAGWAGDAASMDLLKDRLTSRTLAVESKGKDATLDRNCLHVLITTNHDWIVPVTSDSRRFAMFRVLEGRRGDHDFWDAVGAEMEWGGGLEAMMHELVSRPLGGWHPRRSIPRTDLFEEQIAMSLGPEAMFWHDILESGDLPEHWLVAGTVSDWKEGHSLPVLRNAVLESFYAQNPGCRRTLQNGKMGRLLKRVGAQDYRPRVNGSPERTWLIPGLGAAGWSRLG